MEPYRHRIPHLLRRLSGRRARRPERDPSAQAVRQPRPDLSSVHDLAEALQLGVVAVLVGRKDRGVVALLRRRHPDLQVMHVDANDKPDQIDLTLTEHGPFALVVDDVRAPRSRQRLFRRAVWHLEPGGHYVLLGAAARTREGREQPVLAMLREARALKDTADATRAQADALALGSATGELRTQGADVLVRRVGRSWLKVSEAQADHLLDGGRRVRGRVLRTLPGETFTSRCTVRESPSPRAGRLPEELTAPSLALREYVDAVCAPGQVTTAQGLLLPDTFRHVHQRRLTNRFVEELAPGAGRPLADIDAATPLPGTYYQLDSEFRGHFGHALTEQLSRFWGWPEAKRLHPDLKALVASNVGRNELAPFELDLFASVGIDRDDVVLIDGPVQVDRLIGATPMFGNPRYVHPAILPVWARAGAELEAAARGSGPTPRKVFCSRRRTHRSAGAFSGVRRECHNGLEVEAMFQEHGFEVVFTEDLDLAQQARLFRNAEVVAGYAGSAMFNMVFCPRPTQVVVISSESYTARNEYLISAAVGHRLDIAWCRPDIPMGDQWNTEAFNSAFTLDFDREGAWLRDVLTSRR